MKHTLLIITALMLVVGCSESELTHIGIGFYDNGKPKSIKTYKDSKGNKDGEKDAKWTGWHENGQKSDERTYKNGELIEETYWDEDGNVYLRQGPD